MSAQTPRRMTPEQQQEKKLLTQRIHSIKVFRGLPANDNFKPGDPRRPSAGTPLSSNSSMQTGETKNG